MSDGLIVLGDALVDITVSPARRLVAGGDVPAAIRIGPGGQGANVAVRLARRGAAVTLACGLADDPAGAMLRAALVAEGLRLVGIDVERTGTVVVLLAPDADRSMLSHRPEIAGAVARGLDGLRDAAWHIVSGYLLLEADGARLATGLATGTSRRAVLGCSLRPADAPGWADAVARLRPDLVVLNRDEAATVLAGAPLAGAVARRFGCLAVVTGRDGAEGALPDGDPIAVAAVSIEAVDATGAGDAFAAALIRRLESHAWPPAGDDLAAALADAVAAGGAVAGVHGAQGWIAGERRPERHAAMEPAAPSSTLPA